MNLSIRHALPCTPEQFWVLFWDPEFDRRLGESARFTRELIEDIREVDGVQTWTMRFIPDRELPGPVARLLGSDKLIYDQTNRLTLAEGKLEWEVLPHVLRDKITAKGVMQIVGTEAGCDRVVDGEVTVRVPLVGGRIEKQILGNVEESYEKAAEVIREFVAQGRV